MAVSLNYDLSLGHFLYDRMQHEAQHVHNQPRERRNVNIGTPLIDAIRQVRRKGGSRRHQKSLGAIHPSRFKEVDDE